MIALILTFLKSFAIDNLKPLFIGGVAIAVLWMAYDAGERHILNQDAAAQLAAGNAALIKERKANEEFNKISSQYESDVAYFGVYSSDSSDTKATTSPSQHTGGCVTQRSGISAVAYNRKVILIHALDGIIDGYRREVNGE